MPATSHSIFSSHRSKHKKAESYYTNAVALATAGDYQTAIASYKDALQNYPDDNLQHYIYWGLGNSYYELDQKDEALRYYYHAILVNPYAHQCYYQRANILESQTKHEAAIQEYDAALRTGADSPERFNYYYGRGLALYNYGAFERAAEDFRAVLSANTNDTQATNARYYLELINQKKWCPGVTRNVQVPAYTVQHTITQQVINPQTSTSVLPCDSPSNYYLRAHEYLQNAMPFEAAQDFYAVTQQGQNNQENALANYYLGLLHEKGKGVQKNGATAVQYYVRAFDYFKDHPEEPLSYYMQAEMFQHGRGVVQNIPEARRIFEDINQNVSSPMMRDSINQHLKLLKDYFVTIEVYRPGLNLPPAGSRVYRGNNPYTVYNDANNFTNINNDGEQEQKQHFSLKSFFKM